MLQFHAIKGEREYGTGLGYNDDKFFPVPCSLPFLYVRAFDLYPSNCDLHDDQRGFYTFSKGYNAAI